MATWTTGVLVHCLAVVSLLIITEATPDQRSGVLANLYKKAAQENRPLILVLDNSLKQNPLTASPQEYTSLRPHYSVKKQTPSFSTYTGQKLPYLLLQNLQKLQNKPQPSKSIIGSLLNYEKRSRPKKRLPFQIERLDWDKSDRRDEYHSLRILIKKNKPGTRSRSGFDAQAIRNSIAINILRQSKGQCDIVEDECDIKNEDSCEVKVECEEPPKSKRPPKADTEECRFSDSCAEDNKEISTKGILLEGGY